MNFVSCTVNPCDVTVHALGKKKEAKKCKLVNVDVYPNPAITSSWNLPSRFFFLGLIVPGGEVLYTQSEDITRFFLIMSNE